VPELLRSCSSERTGVSTALQACLDQVLTQIDAVVLGKPQQVRLAVACLLARGHLLIEDLPGMGKTTLAEALARSFGLAFNRVHFTNDLLPADLSGVSVYEQGEGQFRFHPGPLFCQVLLADEINRASPRTQSALLEAMASGLVSVDGTSHALPQPFFVIATQNGLDQTGTYPLPESQLDRFLMRLSLGYPERAAERSLLLGQANPVHQLQPCLDAAGLVALQKQCSAVAVEPPLVDYVLDLLAASRRGNPASALSPRAAQGLLGASRGWALLEQRSYVIPADVIAVFAAVAEHRLDGGRPQANHNLSRLLLEQVDAVR
jgi:MoxR-like ATPase